MKYVIYLVTSPSNRHYVGITSRTLEERKYHHIYYHDKKKDRIKTKFCQAIAKYSDKLKWEILEEVNNWDTAKKKEIEYIAKYDSYHKGYNATLGGDGYQKWTKEDIKNDALLYKYRSDWRTNSKSKYNAALMLEPGFFEECCRHMTQKTKYTEEEILLDAKKYKTKWEWECESNKFYNAAKGRGNDFYEQCCIHMPKRVVQYNKIKKNRRR